MNPKDPTPKKLYSVKEASDYLQLCESAVRSLVHRGKLKRRTDIKTRGWKFTHKQLVDFLCESIPFGGNDEAK